MLYGSTAAVAVPNPDWWNTQLGGTFVSNPGHDCTGLVDFNAQSSLVRSSECKNSYLWRADVFSVTASNTTHVVQVGETISVQVLIYYKFTVMRFTIGGQPATVKKQGPRGKFAQPWEISHTVSLNDVGGKQNVSVSFAATDLIDLPLPFGQFHGFTDSSALYCVVPSPSPTAAITPSSTPAVTPSPTPTLTPSRTALSTATPTASGPPKPTPPLVNKALFHALMSVSVVFEVAVIVVGVKLWFSSRKDRSQKFFWFFWFPLLIAIGVAGTAVPVAGLIKLDHHREQACRVLPQLIHQPVLVILLTLITKVYVCRKNTEFWVDHDDAMLQIYCGSVNTHQCEYYCGAVWVRGNEDEL